MPIEPKIPDPVDVMVHVMNFELEQSGCDWTAEPLAAKRVIERLRQAGWRLTYGGEPYAY